MTVAVAGRWRPARPAQKNSARVMAFGSLKLCFPVGATLVLRVAAQVRQSLLAGVGSPMLFRSRTETRRIALQLAVLCGLVGSIVWRQQDNVDRLRRGDELHTTTPTAPISPARVPPHLSYSEPSVATAAAPATIAVDVAGGAQLLATVKARGESERRTSHSWNLSLSMESEESVAVDARAVNVGRGGTGVRSRAATTPSDAELARVACVHEHLRNAFGWHERGPLFYLRGCNREAMVRVQ